MRQPIGGAFHIVLWTSMVAITEPSQGKISSSYLRLQPAWLARLVPTPAHGMMESPVVDATKLYYKINIQVVVAI